MDIERTTSFAMRSENEMSTPEAGGNMRTAREPCSLKASSTNVMKASMASKFSPPDCLSMAAKQLTNQHHDSNNFRFGERHEVNMKSFDKLIARKLMEIDCDETYVKLSRGLCVPAT